MTELQAKTLAEKIASALHELARVEAQRAVEEYRARHEPGIIADVEGLKQVSVQARRALESTLIEALSGINPEPR